MLDFSIAKFAKLNSVHWAEPLHDYLRRWLKRHRSRRVLGKLEVEREGVLAQLGHQPLLEPGGLWLLLGGKELDLAQHELLLEAQPHGLVVLDAKVDLKKI